jgi:hypothetical protein
MQHESIQKLRIGLAAGFHDRQLRHNVAPAGIGVDAGRLE